MQKAVESLMSYVQDIERLASEYGDTLLQLRDQPHVADPLAQQGFVALGRDRDDTDDAPQRGVSSVGEVAASMIKLGRDLISIAQQGNKA